MTIKGLAGEYEISETPDVIHMMESFFRSELFKEGIELHPTETVTDYIRRCGFPYSITDSGERNDN